MASRATNSHKESKSGSRYPGSRRSKASSHEPSSEGLVGSIRGHDVRMGSNLSGQQQQHPPHERLITASSMVSGQTILSERIVETEIKVPKRVIREDIVERTIVVPERVTREEIIEETQKRFEKIIEIAKPVYHVVDVEVEEIEYVEKIVEVPTTEYVDKIIHVPKIEYQERVVHVPKIIYQEKIVEVPEIEYVERIVEKVVEVPQIEEEVVSHQVTVPQYRDVPTPQTVLVEIPQNIERNIPVPIEATTVYEFQLPQLTPKYTRKQLAIYAPRFVEVPIPAELMDEHLQRQAIQLQEQVHLLAAQKAPSLAEVEKIAEFVKNNDFQKHIHASNFQHAIASAWRSGSISINSSGQSQHNVVSHPAGLISNNGSAGHPVSHGMHSAHGTSARSPSAGAGHASKSSKHSTGSKKSKKSIPV